MPTFPQDELFTNYKFIKQTKKLPIDYSSSKKETCPMYTGLSTLSFMSIITWLAFVALLVSMARFFWKKADK